MSVTAKEYNRLITEVAQVGAAQADRARAAVVDELRSLAVTFPLQAVERVERLECPSWDLAEAIGASPACVEALRVGRLAEVASIEYWSDGTGSLAQLTAGDHVMRLWAARCLTRVAEEDALEAARLAAMDAVIAARKAEDSAPDTRTVWIQE